MRIEIADVLGNEEDIDSGLSGLREKRKHIALSLGGLAMVAGIVEEVSLIDDDENRTIQRAPLDKRPPLFNVLNFGKLVELIALEIDAFSLREGITLLPIHVYVGVDRPTLKKLEHGSLDCVDGFAATNYALKDLDHFPMKGIKDFIQRIVTIVSMNGIESITICQLSSSGKK